MTTSLRAAALAALLLALAAAGCGGKDRTRSVTGRVVDDEGRPLGGIEVALTSAGRAAPTVLTDAAGRFTVAGVAASYDLLVRGSTTAIAYQGVTRADPTVTVASNVFGGVPGPSPLVLATASAPISVECGGPCPPAGASGATTVGLDAGEAAVTWYTGAPEASAGGTMAFVGPGPVSARLCALYTASAAGAPTAYWYGRSAPATLMAGEALTLPTLALAPVPTRSFHVDAQRPPPWDSFDNPFASVTATFGAASAIGPKASAYVPFAGADFSLPDLPDQATTVLVTHQDGTSGPWYLASEEQVPAGQASVTAVLHAAPSPTAPAPGAAAGFGDRFAWTGEGTLFRVAFGHDPWYPMLQVVTASHSLALPQPPGFLSLGIAAGYPLAWMVTASNEATTVDALLDPQVPALPPARRSTWRTTASPMTVTWR